MVVIVYAIGRSGSGKSTAVRYIKQLATDKNFSSAAISDYATLLTMSKQEEFKEKFRTNEYKGFDVCDFSVMDIAFEELISNIKRLDASQDYDVIFVEFARDTYREAFRKLDSASLLKNAYILFVEASLDICVERIYKRVFKDHGPDYHFLSEKIMRTYFQQDHLSDISSDFENWFDIHQYHLKVIRNEGSERALETDVKDITEHIFQEILSQWKIDDEIKSTQIANSQVEARSEAFEDAKHTEINFLIKC